MPQHQGHQMHPTHVDGPALLLIQASNGGRPSSGLDVFSNSYLLQNIVANVC
jgi:hypothetical protein